jgi:hypothetical protein
LLAFGCQRFANTVDQFIIVDRFCQESKRALPRCSDRIGDRAVCGHQDDR